MTKIIAIGDLHGRDIWKKIVEKEVDADKFIFIGDYFDSFDIPFEKQAENFNNLLEFKTWNPEKVTLLIGNHEYHYFWFAKEKYSGYQTAHVADITEVLNTARKEGLLEMAYQVNYPDKKYLFTHAGITQTWYGNNYNILSPEQNLAKEINDIFYDHPEAFRFTPSSARDNTGDSITQSPIWVRPRALEEDGIEGFIQVVGHTHQSEIFLDEDTKNIHIDTFDHCSQYLAIIDGKPEVRNV